MKPSPAPGPAPLDENLRGHLSGCTSAALANALLRRGVARAFMKHVRPVSALRAPLAGPAYTLRFIPAREDVDSLANYSSDQNVHRRAIEECPPGAVLVIDARGCHDGTSAGDLMVLRLKTRGVGGVVTDGGFRDSAGIAASGFPAFQNAPAPPATPIALHPAELNVPIGCGGVAVYPGDVIFGDADGVVVLPAGLAAEVASEAADAVAYERFAAEEIERGVPLFGLFPATPESRARFGHWQAARHDERGRENK